MAADAQDLEPTWAHRTDDVDTKVEILRRALRTGNHELALGVADSIKDTIANERMLRADPGPVDLPATGWHLTEQLPKPWSRWADGWELCQTVRLSEPIGQARQSEPLDLLVAMPAERVTAPERELRVARLDRGRPGEVCSQVYGEVRRGPYWLAHLVFEADVSAAGQAVFLIFCGNPAAELPDYPSRLSIRGEGVGVEIETPHYVAALSRQMGQLESLTPKWHLGRAAVVHARERPRRATQYRLGPRLHHGRCLSENAGDKLGRVSPLRSGARSLVRPCAALWLPSQSSTPAIHAQPLLHGPDLYVLRRSSLFPEGWPHGGDARLLCACGPG